MSRIVAGCGLCVALGIFTAPVLCQGRLLTFMLKGKLTSESQIYINPNASSPIVRNQTVFFKNLYGFGAEIRYQFPASRVAVGLGAEYFEALNTDPIRVASHGAIPASDGYQVIPVELTGYFIIPASGRSLKISMGGGVGAYFGRRSYAIAGTEARLLDSTPGFGIHVLGGVSYFFTEQFSLTAEMKFRDVKFESTNQFDTSRIEYEGSFITVNTAPFQSRVQTDGIVFELGAGFSF